MIYVIWDFIPSLSAHIILVGNFEISSDRLLDANDKKISPSAHSIYFKQWIESMDDQL